MHHWPELLLELLPLPEFLRRARQERERTSIGVSPGLLAVALLLVALVW